MSPRGPPKNDSKLPHPQPPAPVSPLSGQHSTPSQETEILSGLVENSPGNEGKWFAAAKSAGLYKEANELANRTPCDPKTLTRAARDMRDKKPLFAVEAGMTALRWLIAGHGYEITGLDVREAYAFLIRTNLPLA